MGTTTKIRRENERIKLNNRNERKLRTRIASWKHKHTRRMMIDATQFVRIFATGALDVVTQSNACKHIPLWARGALEEGGKARRQRRRASHVGADRRHAHKHTRQQHREQKCSCTPLLRSSFLNLD